MKKVIPWVIGVVVLAGAGAAYYFWQRKPAPAAPTPPVVTAPAAPNPQIESATHYPAPEPAAPQATAQPLPELKDSDSLAREALTSLVGAEALKKFLVTEEIVRRIVVTIDNLPRKTLAMRLNPVKPVGDEFRTAGKDGSLVIAAENAARYTPYVRVADGVNAKKLVAAYGRLYPLFQKAYGDLGYPKGYFNDRLIFVIDHLLAAPELQGPIALVAPHVQSKFADPALEALSAGQKIMIRMGNENAAVIKAKLREIRRELTEPRAPR